MLPQWFSLVFSNLAFVPVISLAYNANDFTTFGCMTYVALASSLFHIVECHRYNMIGIGASKYQSYCCQKIDHHACLIIGLRFAHLVISAHYIPSFFDLVFLVTSFQILKLSCNMYYIQLHTLWHLMAGYMGYANLLAIYKLKNF